MHITYTRAPSYERLRPLKRKVTATFPVYRNAVEHLVSTAAAPDWKVAHLLGTCAGYAYSDEHTVAMMMARMGLEENRCMHIAEKVDAMFICSTAFLVQSRCGRVAVVCYRGTERTNFMNWLTDADVHPERVPFRFAGSTCTYDVHAGFYRNVRSTRYELITALQRAVEGRSIVPGQRARLKPLEALYITGHSLGAAMAAVLGVMLVTEPAYASIAALLKGIHTFGQPMIGGPGLATACAQDPILSAKMFRFVYGRDMFAAMPPAASGRFAHFGQEYQYLVRRGAGTWRRNRAPTRQSSNPIAFPLALMEFVARKLRRFESVAFSQSLDDHGPQHYIAALTPPDVRSEFGD